MKKYVKAQVVAKNNPQGSYAAGCPTHSSPNHNISECRRCEITK